MNNEILKLITLKNLPSRDFELGVEMVLKTLKLNNLDHIKIEFKIDYKDDANLGYFLPSKPNTIFFNPKTMEKNVEFFKSSYGFHEIGDIKSVFLHELGHFLDHHFSLKNQYMKVQFAKKFEPNQYSTTDMDEEIAEMIRIYLANPYFLKFIDSERYQFMKDRLQTPTACSIRTMKKLYNNLSEEMKFDIKKKFNLDVK